VLSPAAQAYTLAQYKMCSPLIIYSNSKIMMPAYRLQSTHTHTHTHTHTSCVGLVLIMDIWLVMNAEFFVYRINPVGGVCINMSVSFLCVHEYGCLLDNSVI